MNATTEVKFSHIGAARLYEGSVRIDIKTMMAVIPVSEVRKLNEHWPALIFDISEIMKSTDAAPVGKAWVSRSGKAIIYSINGMQYASPLAQIRSILKGDRKYANVSTMNEVPQVATEPQTEATA
jgi:hypothetical protein